MYQSEIPEEVIIMANLKAIPVIYSGTKFESIAAFCRFAEIHRATFDAYCVMHGVKIRPDDNLDEIVENFMKVPHKKYKIQHAKPILYCGTAYKSIVKLVKYLNGRGYKLTAQEVYMWTSAHKMKNVYDYTQIIHDIIEHKNSSKKLETRPKNELEKADEFILRNYDCMTYDEIATKLGMTKTNSEYRVRALHDAGKLRFKHNKKSSDPLPMDCKMTRDIAASVLKGVDFTGVDTQGVYKVRKARVLSTIAKFPKLPPKNYAEILTDEQFSILTDLAVRSNKLTKHDYYVIAEDNKMPVKRLLNELQQIREKVGDEHFADKWEEIDLNEAKLTPSESKEALKSETKETKLHFTKTLPMEIIKEANTKLESTESDDDKFLLEKVSSTEVSNKTEAEMKTELANWADEVARKYGIESHDDSQDDSSPTFHHFLGDVISTYGAPACVDVETEDELKEKEKKMNIDKDTKLEAEFIKYYMLYGKERAARKYHMTNAEAFTHFCEMKDKYEINIVLKVR